MKKYRGGCQTLLCQLSLSWSRGRYSIHPPLHLFNIPIEFLLCTFYEILDFPNDCDHVFLSAHDKLPGFNRTMSGVFSRIFISGEKTTTATHVKHDFHVISKWFTGNIVPRGSQKDFLHLIQAPSMYSLVTVRKVSVRYIIFESIRHSHANITDLNPQIVKIFLPYGYCLQLYIITLVLTVKLYLFSSIKPRSITAASIKLMRLHDPIPLSSQS